jgi:hypothetical protein
LIGKTLLAINSKEILEFEISIKSVINYCEKNNIEIQLVKDVLFVEFEKKSIQITSKKNIDESFSVWECY